MSNPYQQELQNDNRLQELASKISVLRGVTNDIHAQASDYSLIDSSTESMTNMLSSLRGSANRLARSSVAGYPVWKLVGVGLVVLFIIYTLSGYV